MQKQIWKIPKDEGIAIIIPQTKTHTIPATIQLSMDGGPVEWQRQPSGALTYAGRCPGIRVAPAHAYARNLPEANAAGHTRGIVHCNDTASIAASLAALRSHPKQQVVGHTLCNLSSLSIDTQTAPIGR